MEEGWSVENKMMEGRIEKALKLRLCEDGDGLESEMEERKMEVSMRWKEGWAGC